jgi:hypothetical protein
MSHPKQGKQILDEDGGALLAPPSSFHQNLSLYSDPLRLQKF